MNSDIVKGKAAVQLPLNQIKGEVQKTFGRLTNDDMQMIEGDATKAVGLLQERYGYTRDEADRRWTEFVAAQTAKVQARNAAENVKSKM